MSINTLNKVRSYQDVFNTLQGNYLAFNLHYRALDLHACLSGYTGFADYLTATNKWHTLTTQ